MSEESKEQTDWLPLVGAALGEVLGIARREGRKQVGVFAQRGRDRIELYQAKKDLDSLYRKLGMEAVRLVEGGEIDHPGLVEGAERIHRQQAVVAVAQEQNDAEEE